MEDSNLIDPGEDLGAEVLAEMAATDGARPPGPRSLPQLESGAAAIFLRRGEAAALDAFLDQYLSPLHDSDAEFTALANYPLTEVLIVLTHFPPEQDAPA